MAEPFTHESPIPFTNPLPLQGYSLDCTLDFVKPENLPTWPGSKYQAATGWDEIGRLYRQDGSVLRMTNPPSDPPANQIPDSPDLDYLHDFASGAETEMIVAVVDATLSIYGDYGTRDYIEWFSVPSDPRTSQPAPLPIDYGTFFGKLRGFGFSYNDAWWYQDFTGPPPVRTIPLKWNVLLPRWYSPNDAPNITLDATNAVIRNYVLRDHPPGAPQEFYYEFLYADSFVRYTEMNTPSRPTGEYWVYYGWDTETIDIGGASLTFQPVIP
jgi:hypothetical protein